MEGNQSRTYHIDAVVLRHIEYGEADRVLTLFSLERGKMSAIARGVRKIRSRKAGHLMPFTHVALFLARGHNLDVITQAQAQNAFEGLRADLIRTAYAAYVAELVDRFSFEDSENRPLFRLLVETLERLNAAPQAATSVHYFEVHLMDLLGFRPELTRCVSCGREIEAVDQYFSPRMGGALCPRCVIKDPHAWPVSMNALKYLRFFQRSPWAMVEGRVIPAEVEGELKALLERYLTYLLEYSLRTPPFLDAVK